MSIVIFRSLKKMYKFQRINKRYLKSQKNFFKGKYDSNNIYHIDDDLFKLVTNDPYLTEVLKDYNIDENNLRLTKNFLIVSGAGQFVRSFFVPAATFIFINTLTYICKKIYYYPELLKISNKSNIQNIPVYEDEWSNISASLILHFEDWTYDIVKDRSPNFKVENH